MSQDNSPLVDRILRLEILLNTRKGAVLVNRTFPWEKLKSWVEENDLEKNVEQIRFLEGRYQDTWADLCKLKRCPPVLRYTLIKILRCNLPPEHEFNAAFDKLLSP